MELRTMIFALFLLTAAMLASLTFIGGFADNYDLNDTQDFEDDKYGEFMNVSTNLYNYSQDIQNTTSGVTQSSGEDNLLAGLWVIPQALSILVQLPSILIVFMSTIVGLGDSVGFGLPSWVPGLLTGFLTAAIFIAIASVVWKWKI